MLSSSRGGFLGGGSSGTDLSSGGTITGDLTVNGHLTMASGKQIRADPGTAAAPGVSFNGATNIGLHQTAGALRSGVAGGNQFSVFSSQTRSDVNWFLDAAMTLSGEGTKVANYTATSTDAIVVMNGAALTLTLPAAPANQLLYIKNIDAGSLTVARNGKSIDGAAADVTMATMTGELFFYDGTAWFRLNR